MCTKRARTEREHRSGCGACGMQASVNPKAETVEELQARRKNLHMGMMKLAKEDLALSLQARNEDFAVRPVPSPQPPPHPAPPCPPPPLPPQTHVTAGPVSRTIQGEGMLQDKESMAQLSSSPHPSCHLFPLKERVTPASPIDQLDALYRQYPMGPQ